MEEADIKAEMRKNIRDRIGYLPKEKAVLSNKEIISRVLNLPEFIQAEAVFCFVGTDSEIDTRPILEYALKNGKRLAVPRCIGPGIMKAYEINSLDELRAGAYGIEEPKEYCRVLEADKIDIAFLPCLSCDRAGGRLGQGGGYYDRYLEGRNFLTAALCRDMFLSERIPMNEWDQKTDIVITEKEVIHCR